MCPEGPMMESHQTGGERGLGVQGQSLEMEGPVMLGQGRGGRERRGRRGESRPGGRVRTEAAHRRAWEKQVAFQRICRTWGEQWGRGRARWHFGTWGLA